MNYKPLFEEQFAALQTHDLFTTMEKTVEGSPWHREANVLVHTNMVVDEYRKQLGDEWTHSDYLGALACAFHDVGKPAAKVRKYKPERGEYWAFHGHEIISARLFEDYAVSNMPDFGSVDIFKVSWMIEHHMPWSTEDPKKLSRILRTAEVLGKDAYVRALRADQRGRIADDHPKKLADVEEWIEKLLGQEVSQLTDALMYESESRYKGSVLHMPIAPSGAGKSTLRQKIVTDKAVAFSLDDLRHEFYDRRDYSRAFELSQKDSKFENKANARFVELLRTGFDVYVDNMNLSAKRRAFYLNEAKRYGYWTRAYLLPISIEELMRRQKSRPDKTIPAGIVRGMYNQLQLPMLGEFDEVVSLDANRSA